MPRIPVKPRVPKRKNSRGGDFEIDAQCLQLEPRTCDQFRRHERNKFRSSHKAEHTGEVRNIQRNVPHQSFFAQLGRQLFAHAGSQGPLADHVTQAAKLFKWDILAFAVGLISRNTHKMVSEQQFALRIGKLRMMRDK